MCSDMITSTMSTLKSWSWKNGEPSQDCRSPIHIVRENCVRGPIGRDGAIDLATELAAYLRISAIEYRRGQNLLKMESGD